MTTFSIPQDLANDLLYLAGVEPVVIDEDTGDTRYYIGGDVEHQLTLEQALPLALTFIADHADIAWGQAPEQQKR
jgi:hypothetical protein